MKRRRNQIARPADVVPAAAKITVPDVGSIELPKAAIAALAKLLIRAVDEEVRRQLALRLKGKGKQADANPATYPADGLAKVNEACAFLRLSRDAIYKLIQSGELPSMKVGRSRRIRWDDIHAMTKRRDRK